MPPRHRRDRKPLSRELILDTAIALADAEGVDAVSMRRVAARLGVQAMSLYNHIESKQHLLDGMAGRLLASMDIPAVGSMNWKDAIRTICRSYRALAHAHPALFPLTVARPMVSPESLSALESTLAIVIEEGFDAETALDAYFVVGSYVAGFALGEIGTRSEPGTAIENPLPPANMIDDRFPITAGVVHAGNPDLDRAFETGLDLLIDGFDRLRRRG